METEAMTAGGAGGGGGPRDLSGAKSHNTAARGGTFKLR